MALFGHQNEDHASGYPLGMLKSLYITPGNCCDTIGDNRIPHGGGDNRYLYTSYEIAGRKVRYKNNWFRKLAVKKQQLVTTDFKHFFWTVGDNKQ